MCYSAQVEANFREYKRMTGAELDIDQFTEIYGPRFNGASIRIPRGLDRNFDHPATKKEQALKDLIDGYRAATVTKLEQEIFAQRKRLADAERKLVVKESCCRLLPSPTSLPQKWPRLATTE